LAYLVAVVAVVVARPIAPHLVPHPHWLVIHLLLLGAATNAILVWSAHFAAAVLHTRAPAGRPAEAARLLLLNVGVLAVLIGGSAGPTGLALAGAGVVFVAVAGHLWAMAADLRRALPARFAVTVHYYLAAAVALLAGVPVGAWMLVVHENGHEGDRHARLELFHVHVNLLGWIAFTVLGTLVTLWPTVLRTRMVAGSGRTAARALPWCVAGLAVLSLGLLAWWPVVAVAGLTGLAAGVGMVLATVVATGWQRPPASFAAWSIAAALGWLLLALVMDAVILVRAGDAEAAADRSGPLLVPLAVGFVAQVLIGALAYLLPMVLGGGPGPVSERTARLDRQWPLRVGLANLALAVFLLPVPASVHIAAAALMLAALVRFLGPALLILLSRTR
jgi:nitrite reductase (NO-forming)